MLRSLLSYNIFIVVLQKIIDCLNFKPCPSYVFSMILENTMSHNVTSFVGTNIPTSSDDAKCLMQDPSLIFFLMLWVTDFTF